MQVKSIAGCSKGSILLNFRPSLSYQKLFRSFERPFYTGFTVHVLIFSVKNVFVLANSIDPEETQCSSGFSMFTKA